MSLQADDVASRGARSVEAILANQHPTGAFIASPDFAEYRYCWLRDGSFVAHALDRAGEFDAASRFHDWCGRAIEGVAPLVSAALERRAAGKAIDPSHMPPARFSLSGDGVLDDWPNFQIDGYGTWLWSLRQHLLLVGNELTEHLVRATRLVSDYLAELGTIPCFDVWEEAGDEVHTSTLACVYGGLRAAGELLEDPVPLEKAESLRAAMLEQARSERYFQKSNHNSQVDASLLWVCRPFGVVEADEPSFTSTISRIRRDLDFNGGLRRYATDTYYGGGAWPLLTAWLGWHHASIGELDEARRRYAWVAERFDAEGHLAEQFGGQERDPAMYDEWVKRWGPPARDLLWSHAMFIVLSDEIARSAGQEASD